MNTSKILTAAVLAATLAGTAVPAAAAESVGTRAASAVGYWIAAQGDQALRDIREEFRERLIDSLRPLLPQPAPEQAPAGTGPAPANG